MSLFGMVDASAAPSVKRLGTNTVRIGANTPTVKSQTTTTTAAPQRLSTVRKNVAPVAPVAVNKTVSAATPDTDDATQARLSLGKYIHSTGVATGNIKPSTTPTISSSDFINLTDRVTNLESNVDLKQDAISAGDGLVMDNDTIGLNPEYVQIPERIDSLQTQIDTKVSASELNDNYYTKTQINKVLGDLEDLDIDTIYDAATGTRKYVSVIDIFDKDEVLN